ncbi:MAG TPA: TlpA disulfide reductase family protein [Candidatus Sulfotelmatobacter sp.]|nr:TlpA disulfide reductase family protein [Candidatus Sulfotelmatobacter sp.]
MFRPFLACALGLVLLGVARHPSTIFDLADAVGKPAPAITLLVDGGQPLSLASLRGEPTYVFLFASWCGPCQLAMPFVRADYARFGERVRFLGVDVLDEPGAARAAIAKDALPFPVAIYPIDELDATIAPVMQLQAGMKYEIPTDFLLDASGVVRYVWHGLAVGTDGSPQDVLPSYLAKLGIE